MQPGSQVQPVYHQASDRHSGDCRPLKTELSKGKASQKADKALTEIRALAAFNQNVSFCMRKAMQHLADIIFVQMRNIPLLSRYEYLDHVKTGIKPDT